MNAAFKKDLKICKPNSTHPLVIFLVRSRTPHMPHFHSASVPSVPLCSSNPAKTRRVVAHASVTFCNTRHRLSISFGRVSHQASPSRHTPSSAHPVTGYGFSQEIQKYPKTEVLQDVTPTPPSTFPYLQQALKPSCKSPQSPRKAHQHPPPSYTPGSA